VLNTELRPLGAGEMLDRAITLFVRRFAQIAAVLAVVTVPLMLVEALVAPESAHAFSDLGRILAAAGNTAASSRAADDLTRASAMTPLGVLVVMAASLVRVMMWCAILAVVAAAYAGTTTTLGAAYRLALRRWLPQLLVGFAFAILGGFALIPVFVLYLIVVFAAAALFALHQLVLAVVIGVIGGIVVLGGAAIIGSLAFMAYELAAVAIVTETGNPVEAVGIGLRRALAPGMKRRTVVGGLVLLAVTYGGTLPIVAAAAFATALTHVDALYFAIMGAGTLLLDGIMASFVVVYAVDARVRREGFDIVVPGAPAVSA
jgi:hypothetical protein